MKIYVVQQNRLTTQYRTLATKHTLQSRVLQDKKNTFRLVNSERANFEGSVSLGSMYVYNTLCMLFLSINSILK